MALLRTNLLRFIAAEPAEEDWAVVPCVALGAPPDGYEWTTAAAVMTEDRLDLVGGAVLAERQRLAVASRRLLLGRGSVESRRVLHTTDGEAATRRNGRS